MQSLCVIIRNICIIRPT